MSCNRYTAAERLFLRRHSHNTLESRLHRKVGGATADIIILDELREEGLDDQRTDDLRGSRAADTSPR